MAEAESRTRKPTGRVAQLHKCGVVYELRDEKDRKSHPSLLFEVPGDWDVMLMAQDYLNAHGMRTAIVEIDPMAWPTHRSLAARSVRPKGEMTPIMTPS